MGKTIRVYNDTKNTYKLSLQATALFESGDFYTIHPGESDSWNRNPNNGAFAVVLQRPDNTVVKRFTLVVVIDCRINISDILNYANDVLNTIA
jgi:hypothetical protein